MAETAPQGPGTRRKSLIFAENVLYWAHYKPILAMRILWPRWVPAKHRTGAWQFRAQAVSQKTRKKSASKTTKKAAPASRSATKGRAKASVKDARKVAATKSSKNKRSAMPEKPAKTAAKATGSKTSAPKVAPKAPLNKAPADRKSVV